MVWVMLLVTMRPTPELRDSAYLAMATISGSFSRLSYLPSFSCFSAHTASMRVAVDSARDCMFSFV